MAHFCIFNPNSSAAITEAMDRSLDGLRARTQDQFSCVTNFRGPAGIDTDEDVLTVIPDVVQAVQALQADAYIIACFSDPGLDQARLSTRRPVLGIGEAAYLTAMGVAGRFGVISDQDYSTPRHRARLDHMRFAGRLAGDRAIGVSIGDLEGPEVYDKLFAVGRALRDSDRADVIILGCAGMGPYRERLQQSLGLPVIDPVQAAVAQACALFMLDIVEARAARQLEGTPPI